MEIVYIKIKDLIPFEKNAKKHDKTQIDNVAESIKQFGMVQPIVVDKDNVVIIGHCRLEACKKLKYKEVPCVKTDDLTEEQVAKLRLLDNKLNESDWDFDLLGEELFDLDLSEFELDWGVPELVEEEKEVEEDDFDCTPPEQPKAKLGDIYQLGNHRLMCGDSTKEEDVAKLMNGNKADMVFTDPPYGVSIVQGDSVGGGGLTHFGHVRGEKLVKTNSYMPIKGDDTTETARLNYEIIKEISANQIIFGGNYFTDFLPPKACWCIWDKENTGNFADVEMAWTSFNKGAKLYRWLWNGLCRKGERSVEGKTRVHPTQKPVGLIAEIFKDFTKERDIILDCFGGSGSTLIACEQTNRTCYMMEYEPHYCDVIIARWEQFTGKKVEKLN